MRMSLNRRSLLRNMATSGAALAASGMGLGRGLESAIAADLKTIKVTHFGGPYQSLDKLVGAPFAKAGLGKVSYEVEYSVTAVSKLMAQPNDPPFDVGMIARAVALRAANAGMLSKLTPAELPALNDVYKEAVMPQNFGVAMVTDAIDIMYNTKKISEKITSWNDLWRPDVQKNLILPAKPLSLVLYLIVSLARTLEGDANSPKAIDAAFKKFSEMKGKIRTYFTDPVQATQLIERGDIGVAPQFSVRIANTIKATPHIARGTPKEGVPAVPYDLCLAKGSPNQKTAKDYINFVLGKDIQEALAAQLLATPVNKSVALPPDLNRYALTDFKKLWFVDDAFMAKHQAEWFDRWAREVVG